MKRNKLRLPVFCLSTIAIAMFAGSVMAREGGAGVTTIDFDSFAPTAAFPGGVEDGFLIEVPIGPIAVDGLFPALLGGPFSEPNSIHHPTNAPAAFALTNIDESTFTLESFFAGSNFGGADPLIVTGFVGGVVVGVDVFDPNPPGTYFMFTPTNLAGVTVDTLLFDLGPSSVGPTHIDDITLATIATVVSPESFEIVTGVLTSGGLAELAASDNADLTLRRSFGETRTEFRVKGVSPVDSPSSFEITFEGSVTMRGDGVTQTVELFNYDAGDWEAVDARVAKRFEQTVQLSLTGDLSRFVEFNTRCLEAKISYDSSVPRTFSSFTDQFNWTILP